MDKRIKEEPKTVESPYWLNDTMTDRQTVEDRAKKDAKEVSDRHRSDIAKRVLELTQNA